MLCKSVGCGCDTGPVALSFGDETGNVFRPGRLNIRTVVEIKLAIDDGGKLRIARRYIALRRCPSAMTGKLWQKG